MNQIQGTSSVSTPDLPMKRKRGRPRKDENLVHESMPAIPGPDSLKKNKQSAGTNDDAEDEMVGRMVSGVIEGSFDAGYLLNVKVEDTDTQLRGVVFLPGKFTPVTAENDIAPNVKMCKRKEVPIPAVNVQSHIYGSAHPSEQSNKQPVEVKKQIPAVPDHVPPHIPQCGIVESFKSQSFSGIPETLRSQCIQKSFRNQSFSGIPESSSFVIPPVDNLLKNDAPAIGGKAMPQQPLESVLDNQSTYVMTKSENKDVVGQEKVLEEVEPATTITESTGVEGIKESKIEKSSESIGELPSIETVCKDPLLQPQAVDTESSALVREDIKSLNFELNHNPVFAEAVPAVAVIPSVDIVCKALQVQSQTVDTEKSHLVDDEVKSVNVETNQTPEFAEPAASSVILGAVTVCKDPQIQSERALDHDVVKSLDLEMNHTPPLVPEPAFAVCKPVENLMEEDAAPKPSQLLGGETAASIGSIPSTIGEPPTGAIDSMDCDIADTIPPAQS
ncbi:uncharacterized protein LOC126788429 [Argentina anserina]|uniref:uncharacterized protein LOC126788429 n=1 Tax=Argentina anserina TaxID=57926 RepID=UPI00217666AE|nr:uncharacterized protein LOC126788429 [Potentilla anserina]